MTIDNASDEYTAPASMAMSRVLKNWLTASIPQVRLAHGVVGLELIGGAARHDPARLEHVASLGDLEGEVGVLLHDQHRGPPFPVDLAQPMEELLRDLGSEAERRLVEEQ